MIFVPYLAVLTVRGTGAGKKFGQCLLVVDEMSQGRGGKMKELLRYCGFLKRQHSNKAKKGVALLGYFCLCALTSCAVRTPVPQMPASLVAENLKYENIVFKEFKLAPNLQSNVPTAGPLAECVTSSIGYLVSKDVFKRVERKAKTSSKVEGDGADSYDEPTLVVEGNLTFLRIVKGAARFFGGVFVGRSAMKMDHP